MFPLSAAITAHKFWILTVAFCLKSIFKFLDGSKRKGRIKERGKLSLVTDILAVI